RAARQTAVHSLTERARATLGGSYDSILNSQLPFEESAVNLRQRDLGAVALQAGNKLPDGASCFRGANLLGGEVEDLLQGVPRVVELCNVPSGDLDSRRLARLAI